MTSEQINLLYLYGYLMFLLVFVCLVNNSDVVTKSPLAESIGTKLKYDLRDLPRVNYKETSSDEENSDDSENENEASMRSSY
jgi:hypothetical protein